DDMFYSADSFNQDVSSWGVPNIDSKPDDFWNKAGFDGDWSKVPDKWNPNDSPYADFSFSPSGPTVGESVSFDGSLSSDSDGSIQLFEWDWDGDGTYESAGENPSNSFGSSGDQTVELKVKDDDGSTNTTTKTVSVGATTLSVDWSSYSSSTNVNGFRIYYGVGSIDESNMVEVGSSTDSKQISDNSWNSGDNICVEVRPFNSNGEASSDEQCLVQNSN
ncbi:MAG: PKD domain-containing protein, partial [Nanohaloarchaea archaeon]|nr:PKD domain-containing protein [Candidatus Nanohaloarchaea archaeon]